MNKTMTVTIGIPAYNEEANLGRLLDEILRQDFGALKLEEIIVASDGSTDGTNGIVRRFGGRKVRLIEGQGRQGVSAMLNSITSSVSSDILVILNADIAVEDSRLVSRLAAPLREGRADLSSCAIRPAPSRNRFEAVLAFSMELKTRIFEEYRGGNSLYTCFGPARAYSRRLYKSIYFGSSTGDDAFSYLFCRFKGWDFKYVRETGVFYRLPGNLEDHRRQSLRFFRSRREMEELFGARAVSRQYRIPLPLVLRIYWRFLREDPLRTVAYSWLLARMKLEAFFASARPVPQAWEISPSSKKMGVSNA